MTKYHVHIYREMRLVFGDIEADKAEAAAAIVRDKPTNEADDIEDCEGENLAALVDVAGDDQYEQSVTVDFEGERIRKAAPKMLDVLRWVACCPMIIGPVGTTAYIISDEKMAQARAAIAEAAATGVLPAPSEIEAERVRRAAPVLLSALETLMADIQGHAAEFSICDEIAKSSCGEAAEAAIAMARVAGLTPVADPNDIHALLIRRQEIALIWGIDDVRTLRPDLNDDQCWEVLQDVDRHKDAGLGISWFTLESAAESLFGDASDEA